MIKSQYEEAFHVQKVLMTLTGLWPKKNRVWYTLYGFVMTFVIQAVFMMPSFVTLFYPSTDVAHGSYILFCTLTVFTYGIKVIGFYVKRNTFHEIITDLEQPLFQNYNSDGEVYMKRAIFVSNQLRKLIQFPCIIFIAFLIVFPLLEEHTQRPLPFVMPINVNELSFSLYLSVYIFQVIAAGICACNNGNMDTLACTFMVLGTAELKILRNNLKCSAINVSGKKSGRNGNRQQILENYGQNDPDVIKNLNNCVKHHIAITKYVDNLEKMFANLCLAQFLTSVAAICFAGFTFIVVPVTNLLFGASVSYFAAAMVEISLYCISGDELMVESLKVSDACYMSEWDHCGPEIRKTLLIIMERSKRPLVLTAGKFATLSRDSLVTLTKSSFSYFAVGYCESYMLVINKRKLFYRIRLLFFSQTFKIYCTAQIYFIGNCIFCSLFHEKYFPKVLPKSQPGNNFRKIRSRKMYRVLAI